MNTTNSIVIKTKKLSKFLSAIAILLVMALLFYVRKNIQSNDKLLYVYYLSFLFPLFSMIVISSILFELKRGYAIELTKTGIQLGFFSIEFFIPWNAVSEIELKDRKLNRWPFTLKYQTMQEIVIKYNHQERKFSRKLNILDYLFDLVLPFIRNDLHISSRMINTETSSIINYYMAIKSSSF